MSAMRYTVCMSMPLTVVGMCACMRVSLTAKSVRMEKTAVKFIHISIVTCTFAGENYNEIDSL